MNIALKRGKVELGSKSALAAAKTGKAKLIILASNCPENLKEQILRNAKASGIPTHLYSGTSRDLGTVCGKPFIVAAITVKDAGDSEILRLAEGEYANTKN
ncbi:50S ribosomal protein L30e [Candidatus Bathyarchaeota archaeon]|nr:50S ribosomal protein L30e [Candidatus Bathyarchaeota archaeon]MBS7626095.1 50S ribosomal protein L30e [Candidatus Bathyarchaeota archaeon]